MQFYGTLFYLSNFNHFARLLELKTYLLGCYHQIPKELIQLLAVDLVLSDLAHFLPNNDSQCYTGDLSLLLRPNKRTW